MKVVLQIIIFLILLAVGWFLYGAHSAFQVLVDDIFDYSGITREINRRPAEVARADIPVTQVTKPQYMSETVERVAKAVEQDPAIDVSKSGTADFLPIDESETAGYQEPIDALVTALEPELGAAMERDRRRISVTQPPVLEAGRRPLVALSAGKVSADNVKTADSSTANGQQMVSSNAVPDVDFSRQQALFDLAVARTAWFRGNHDKAVMLYEQLLQEHRNHPDFAGELGNIYFSRGQIKLGLDAYSEAFLRLLRNNDLPRAEHVLSIVRNIDPERARLLWEYSAYQ